MGLAGAKTRTKIGADPNNTNWSKSTDRFGHKILTAQGWKPGDTLGADNASHSAHYTAASSSHIRVLLREDGLGLGAKNGRQDADTFGLDMLQGLLGRLNGKSEEVLKKEEGYRRDLKLQNIVVKKFGGTTFVSGGYLVGDKIEKELNASGEGTEQIKVEEIKQSKKRKRSDARGEGTLDEHEPDAPTSKSRRSKKDKRQDKQPAPETDDPETEDRPPESHGNDLEDISPSQLSEKELKRQRKAEKRATKEARRAEKAERKRLKALRNDGLADFTTVSASTSGTATPSEAASSTSLLMTASVARGRFAVRSRYSIQKRMAVTDQQALKEIFMIKSGA